SNQQLRLFPRHRRQVVDVQVALPAEPRAVVASHLVPVRVARRCDPDMVQWIAEAHHCTYLDTCGATYLTNFSVDNVSSLSIGSRPMIIFEFFASRTTSTPSSLSFAKVSTDLSVNQICTSALPLRTNFASSAVGRVCLFLSLSTTATNEACSF